MDAVYPVAAGQMPIVETAGIEAALGDTDLTVIDARDAQRFAGENEPIDPKAGHIPGARNRPFQQNLRHGLFKRPAELQQEFAELLQDRPGTLLASSCGSGVTACHNLFAMELAEFGTPEERALYVGSWSEWVAADERPVATLPSKVDE